MTKFLAALIAVAIFTAPISAFAQVTQKTDKIVVVVKVPSDQSGGERDRD